MKKLQLLNLFFLSTLLVFTACQKDEFVDVTPDAEGQGSAIITIGTGGETFISSQTWTRNNTYLLNGLVRLSPGDVLTIEAGTTIKGLEAPAGGVPGTLIVERGARIEAAGTAALPIIFTSNQPAGSRQAGDWGGVIILGSSYTNVKAGVNGAPENYVGAIEGIPTGFSPALYGSGDPNQFANQNDNSGTFTYVRIEYAGNVLSEGNETNGLTLGGVGRGTTIHHVLVNYGSDDAFEWFGGWVRAKYLVALNTEDDDFDSDQGNNSFIQFAISQKNPEISVAGSGGARSIESNGDNDDAVDPNLGTNATYSNLSLIGPAGPFPPYCTSVSPNFVEGIAIRDLSRLDIFNSAFGGFPKSQYFLEFTQTFGGRATTKNNQVVKPNIAGSSISNVGAPFVASKWSNAAIASTGCAGSGADIATNLGLRGAAWRYPVNNADAQPDFVPPVGSPLLSGADFSDLLLQFPYFDVVNFRGAISRDASGPGSVSEWGLNSAWYEITPQDN